MSEILHHGYSCPMTNEQITEALWKLGGYSPEGVAVQQTVGWLRAALAERTATHRFGLSALAAWWNEGSPGDVDGADLQEFAERAGLWHHVDRHAEDTECEWCGNDGSGCGELTEAGERAWAEAEDMPVRPAPSRVDELTVLLRESNAVCACGCSESGHEGYGEDGESCGAEGHECVRTSRTVAGMLATLRAALAEAQRERDEARSETWWARWQETYLRQREAEARAECAERERDWQIESRRAAEEATRAHAAELQEVRARAEAAERELAEAEADRDAWRANYVAEVEARKSAERELAEAREVIRHCLAYLENGDFSNGIGEFGQDEGRTVAFQFAEEVRAFLAREAKPEGEQP